MRPVLPHPFTVRVEDQLYQSAVRPFPQHFLLELSAQRKIDTADQQGFTRARLTGQNIQPSSEFYLCLFHQSKIFHM